MREPKPFFRKFTKSWYVEIRGKQINLGRDKDKAWAKYRQLIATPEELDSHTTTVVASLSLFGMGAAKSLPGHVSGGSALPDFLRQHHSEVARRGPPGAASHHDMDERVLDMRFDHSK